MEEVFRTVSWTEALPLPQPQSPPSRASHACADLSEIIPGLFLTCEETANQREHMQLRGVRLILTMNASPADPPFQSFAEGRHDIIDGPDEFARRLQHELARTDGVDNPFLPVLIRSVAADDTPSYDLSQHFDEMCCLLELVLSARNALAAANAPGALPAVVVHCMAGISRSSTIVMAYLMKRSKVPLPEVLAFIRATRPVVCPNTGFHAQLAHWETTMYNRLTSRDVATRVGRELALKPKSELLQSVSNLFGLVIQTFRMKDDRLNLPHLLAWLVEHHVLSAEQIRGAMHSVVAQAVVDESFVDCPTLFSNLSELCAAMRKHCVDVMLLSRVPSAAKCGSASPKRRTTSPDESGCYVSHVQRSTPDLPSDGSVFDDDIHFEFLQLLVDRDGCDAWGTCEAALGYIHHVHRFRSHDGIVSCRIGDASTVTHVHLPPCMQMPFPVIGLLAKYAEGFTNYQEWQAVEKDPQKSLALLRRRFLVCRDDGALAAIGTQDAVRWSSPFVAFLRDDIEVGMLETLLAAEKTILPSSSPTDDARNNSSGEWVNLKDRLDRAVRDVVIAASGDLSLEQALLKRLEEKCMSAAEVVFTMIHPDDGESFLAKLRHVVRNTFRGDPRRVDSPFERSMPRLSEAA